MALFDLPLDELRTYRPERVEPDDLDAFWQRTLDQARTATTPTRLEPVDSPLTTVDVHDLTFPGFAGQPVSGWLLAPRHGEQPLPCVVEFIGYGGGRGLWHERLLWSAAGYAHLVMDTRGQGSNGSTIGATPDPDLGEPATRGFLTRGIGSPDTYYYRRLYADAVRAVDAARALPGIDPDRVAVHGRSQGGAMAIAAAALGTSVRAAMVDVPFLCHVRRATEITDAAPYDELATYCRTHRDRVDDVFGTLAYIDGVNLAARARVPTLFSVGLMDEVCPPSTVFAAYNNWAHDDKQIRVWPYNEHDGGGAHHQVEQLSWLGAHLGPL